MLAGLSSSSVTNAIELHIKGVPISSSVAAPASEESVTLSVPDELSLALLSSPASPASESEV